MTGADFQAKHATNLKASSDEIRKGVEAVTESPGSKAAKRADVYIAKMTSSEVHERWKRNVAKVSLEDWKKDMVEKGIGRISAGLDRSKDKITDFGDKLIAFQKAALPAFDARRPITIEESAQKAADWIKEMAKFSYKK